MSIEIKIPVYLRQRKEIVHSNPQCLLEINKLNIQTFQNYTNLQKIALPHKVKFKARHLEITDPKEIDALMDEILDTPENMDRVMTQYINVLYTTTKHKLNEPFISLQYDSAVIELKTRTLTTYPEINSEGIFQSYQKFLKDNNLKDCRVNMCKDNLVYEAEQETIRHFIQKLGTKGPANNRAKFNSYLMEKY